MHKHYYDDYTEVINYYKSLLLKTVELPTLQAKFLYAYGVISIIMLSYSLINITICGRKHRYSSWLYIDLKSAEY